MSSELRHSDPGTSTVPRMHFLARIVQGHRHFGHRYFATLSYETSASVFA